MAVFLTNKYLPTLWTDSTPDHVITEFLRAVREQQSPIVKYIQDRIKTPDGRPVTFVCIDATHLGVEKSADPFLQMGRFSGQRGKGHLQLQTTLTDPNGSVLAIAPGGFMCMFLQRRFQNKYNIVSVSERKISAKVP